MDNLESLGNTERDWETRKKRGEAKAKRGIEKKKSSEGCLPVLKRETLKLTI